VINVPFTQIHKEFALQLYYCSPKAYDFVRQTFTLPAPSTLRKLVSTVQCYPGFLNESFEELSSHKGDIHYKDAALVVDAMSIKELAEFDPVQGKPFGFVDCGGLQDFGETDETAKEALVVLLVGYRRFWKLPLGYFLVSFFYYTN